MITIRIFTDNSAFEDNPNELGDILQRLADHWVKYNDLPETERDSNGNTVCDISMEVM
jgi:hypothetical protein